MTIFSFHAEIKGDIELLKKTVESKGFKFDITMTPDPQGLSYLDVEGTTDMPIKELKKVVDEQVDAHVIARTLENMAFAEVKEKYKSAGPKQTPS